MHSKVDILIVDDNPEFAQGLKLMLAKDEVNLFSAYSGEEGLAKFGQHRPDLVLLDIIMPGMDGFEVCRQIRKRPENSNVYIVMLSGVKITSEQQAAGLEAGANGYIVRPIPNRELLARIRTFIRLKQAEKKLEESEKKYKTLFDSMIMAYAHHAIITDSNGKPCDYRFLNVNPEFERLTGLKSDAVIGKRVLEVLPQTESTWIEKYGKVALTGEEIRFIDFSGSLNKFYEVYAFSPAPGEFSTIFFDVTERIAAEKKIQEINQNLVKLNAEKDKFFSIIAHDLYNPLSGIYGLSELFLNQIEEHDFEGLDVLAKNIFNSTARAIGLLSNLMDWARSQTGRIVFKPEVLILNDLVGNVFQNISAQANQKSVNIHSTLPANTLIFADRFMLSSTLLNLLTNAIKYSNQGGLVELAAVTSTNEILITVKDNGVGMSEKVLNNLFRIGVNQSTPGTQNEKGTGLGLILCKEFVEKHGGSIQAESEEGKGSKFCIRLPIVNTIIDSENKDPVPDGKIRNRIL